MRPECDPLVAAASFIFLSATRGDEVGGDLARRRQVFQVACSDKSVYLLCQVHAQNKLLWDLRSRSR